MGVLSDGQVPPPLHRDSPALLDNVVIVSCAQVINRWSNADGLISKIDYFIGPKEGPWNVMCREPITSISVICSPGYYILNPKTEKPSLVG